METYNDMVLSYNDDDLLTMVYEFGSWDTEMQAAIENELNNRGILPHNLHDWKIKTIAKDDKRLSAGKAATLPLQLLGWIGIFGVLGWIIGYQLYFAKKKSIYTQKEYFKYDTDSRESGRYMLFATTGIIVIFIVFNYNKFFG